MPVVQVNNNVNKRDEFNRTPLHNSVYENRLTDVKNLLLQGADASLTSIKNNTPLHTAASRKFPHMIEALLKYTSREKVRKFINLKTTGSGSTALHVAATNGCTGSVRYLLCYGANFEVRNKAGERAVDVAKDEKTKKLLVDVETDWKLAATGQCLELKSRLSKYSTNDLAASVYARAGKAMTSLQLAVIKNHCNTVKVIVDARDRLQKDYKENKQANLKEFLKYGKILGDEQATLMTHTWDINIIGADRMVEELAGIFFAADCILKLAERDFKPDGDEVYEQPSFLRIAEETIEALEFTAKHVRQDEKGKVHLQGYNWQQARYNKMLRPPEYEGEEDEGFYDENKVFAYMATLQVALTGPLAKFMRPILNIQLSVATENNDFETFEQIVDEQFVDVNFSRGEDKLTPLHHAAMNGNLAMVEVLLHEKKANIAALTNKEKETPLHLAAAKGHADIVEVLLQSLRSEDMKRYVDIKTHNEGRTALHLATAGGYLQTMLRLMRFHATYDVKGKDDKAPKDLFAQDFFEMVDEIFVMAKEGDAKLLQRLGQMQRNQLLAVGNTRNNTGMTIREVAEKKEHRDLAVKIAKIIKDATLPPRQTGSRTSKGFDEDFRRSEVNHLRKALSSSKT